MPLTFDPVPDLQSSLKALRLRLHTSAGGWLVVQAQDFDAVVSGEPYNAIQVLHNTADLQTLVRVWGKTVVRMTLDSTDMLAQVCWKMFYRTSPCSGIVAAAVGFEDPPLGVTKQVPGNCTRSANCSQWYRTMGVAVAAGPCGPCTALWKQRAQYARELEKERHMEAVAMAKLAAKENAKMVAADVESDTASIGSDLFEDEGVHSMRRRRKKKKRTYRDIADDDIFVLDGDNENGDATAAGERPAKRRASRNLTLVNGDAGDSELNNDDDFGVGDTNGDESDGDYDPDIADDGEIVDPNDKECRPAGGKGRGGRPPGSKNKPKSEGAPPKTRKRCKFCPKLIDQSEGKYERHLRMAHASVKYVCPVCSETAELPGAHVDHVKKEHVDELLSTLVAPCCNATVTLESFEGHCKKCFSPKCPYCAKIFVEPTKLLHHKRTAHAMWQHMCATCSYVAVVPNDLVEHVKSEHAETQTTIDCPRCLENLPVEGYEEHCLIQTQKGCFYFWKRIVVCYQCKKRIPRADFTKHLGGECAYTVAGSDKQCGCPYCEQVFDGAGLPMKTHLLDKHIYCAHFCTLCPFVSSQPKDLVEHCKELHSDSATPAECPKCSAVMAATEYEAHCEKCVPEGGKNRDANDGSAIVCDICGESFTLMRYMKEHQRRQHDTGEYICQHCGYKVDTWVELAK